MGGGSVDRRLAFVFGEFSGERCVREPITPCGLNTHWFLSLADAREKVECWRRDYNEVSCRLQSPRQRLAAGLSAELPQVQREALLLPSADDEAGLLDQAQRTAVEMAPACEPAP